MTATHPLDMLTGDEIIRAAEILRESGRVPDGGIVRAHGVARTREGDAGAWQANDPVDRQVARRRRAGSDHGPTRGHRLGDQRRDRRLARPRRHAARVVDDRGDQCDHNHQGAPRVRRRARQARDHRHATRCRSTRGRPVCSVTSARKAGASRGVSRSCRSDTTDNGYARPIEGVIVHFDMGANAVIEVLDHGVTAASTEPGELLRRASAEPARRPEADLDHATRGRELHGQRQPRRLAEVAVPHRVRSVRGARAAPDLAMPTTAGGVRSCTARRSPRWSSPTAIRARCTVGRTRSTRASGVSGG